jgi:hypothetical protein
MVMEKGELNMQQLTKGNRRGMSGMRQWCALLVCISILSLLGGCAKFSASRKMDAGPFSENTNAMMADVTAEVRKPFYIKQYMNVPSVAEYRSEWDAMKKAMRSIVLYSSQLAAIAQSPMTERKKPNALAATLTEIYNGVPDERLAGIGMTRAEVNELIRNVEIQETLLDALGQAQPLLDRSAKYVDLQFDRVEDSLNKLIRDIDAQIDAKWHLNRRNVEDLYALQNLTFRSYALLYQYREGDAASLAALRVNDPALQTALGKDQKVGEKELEATETQIMARLKNLNHIREQIMPQVERYLAEARERDELYTQHKDTGKKLRLTLALWARSHRNLAAGIAVPPEIDLYNVLLGSVKKFSPVPLP